jgi:hypothetical protein
MMSAPATNEPSGGGATASRAPLFWPVALLGIAVGLGTFLAYGPNAIRRPALTPVVVGLLLGLFSGRLSVAMQRAATRSDRAVIGICATAALACMHLQFFREIKAAAEQRRSDSPIPWSEEMLDEVGASESLRRGLRLAARPTFDDYVNHRAVPVIGEAGAPWPHLLLAGELALAVVAAIAVHRRIIRGA